MLCAADGGEAGGMIIIVTQVSFPIYDVRHCFRIQVARKKSDKDGQTLSMGFGFVEVDSEEVAKGVIKKLQVGDERGLGGDICRCGA